AYIDYNNDGDFTSNEVIGMPQTSSTIRAGTFTIPQTAVSNTPVRLRIASSDRVHPNVTCITYVNTQTEDYAIYIRNPLGIKEKLPQLSFSVYPNPSTGQVTVKTETTKTQTLEVVNMLGQVLYTKQLQPNETQEHHLDLSYLPKGMYLVRITSANGETGIQKLILD
ncbi:MAG: T9SS type A sorting domain-containing protein, partial [Hymenobacteraceae bacterium]|nr:T9SS type A sorting domain-containing protein [Hymenobacteraceae bacterium]MDX5397907.1 T9SS type A sorting domain-containing protein [Hymenobacteraceae bacterium]MDX5442843.1 T9SS type A sorting domain-containing protein [Hymenobacteraceae bacterium]MDX5513978.1 T9SS type A sorting domain-containing protein [Hymenobacteraceae bacterium]